MFAFPAQIVEAVKPLRENLDACLIFPSMPAVMKLNKLGTFSMSQLGQSKSMFSEFIKSARKVPGDATDRRSPAECSACSEAHKSRCAAL